MKRHLALVLGFDGDIEIYESGKGRVRHRSYNPGDKLRDNLLEEFDAMTAMEDEE